MYDDLQDPEDQLLSPHISKYPEMNLCNNMITYVCEMRALPSYIKEAINALFLNIIRLVFFMS